MILNLKVHKNRRNNQYMILIPKKAFKTIPGRINLQVPKRFESDHFKTQGGKK